jgi:hypothetical protein
MSFLMSPIHSVSLTLITWPCEDIPLVVSVDKLLDEDGLLERRILKLDVLNRHKLYVYLLLGGAVGCRHIKYQPF